ncbi:hypothetical protein CKO18_16320 [Rhodoferax fermentans]|uniref:Uncharacterized protein n=1 Tax=Rhodoferax fermentans TaxID=28066 RepID=A0A1T1ATJ8_RHOFE|nr:hypothetical protein [Rhodoferax fermentans]MBK1685122.1 hypothetical protein [Rhodoferax fermentans]OOV07333.1 hypothetical protein RF819_11865 [Rhodoferax fermentans]
MSLFAPYLRLAHQIPGRVRLKLDAAALDVPLLRGLGAQALQQALASVRGVQDFSFNLLARSCVITYDNATIPDAAWPDLLAQRPSVSAQTLLAILQESYEELRCGQH